MIIRGRVAEDAAALDAIFAENWRRAEWMIGHQEPPPPFAAVSAGEAIFVAEVAGQVRGLLAVYVQESFIHHLFVAAAYQGQGIGTALLGSLHDWLPQPWRLKCLQANTRALAFYLARGWQEVGAGTSEQGEYLLLQYAHFRS